MSKITLEPNSSGAGTFSIVSPDSNTNRTLNLPDEDGTVLSNAIIGTGPDQIPTNSIVPEGYTDQDALDLFNVTGSAPVYACRAWVNFSQKNSITIQGSGNVSSITDEGKGITRINFATNMPDTGYGISAVGQRGSATHIVGVPQDSNNVGNVTVVHIRDDTGGSVDSDPATVQIFR